jgi:GMP synthase-like glutamine amidotransferase
VRALVLHHDATSTLGLLADLLAERGVDVHEHAICTEVGSPVATGPLPSLDGAASGGDDIDGGGLDVDGAPFDAVVALGSRWSVYDRASIDGWIGDELRLLRTAHDRGIGVLGICFGGQALAAALGGTVTPATSPEIGWHRVESDRPEIADGPWFQWHLDVFTTPPGALELARSPAGPQAFRLGRSVGLQFHPELDVDLLERWIDEDRDQLLDAGVDPDRLLADSAAAVEDARPRTARLLDWFLDDVRRSPR